MDINKIFGLFGNEDPNKDYPEPSEEEVKGLVGFEEFRSTTTYQIKMFQKVILNHLSFQKQLVKMFQNSDPELGEFGDIEEAGEHMAFFRGWSYIKAVDLNNEDWQDCIKIQDPKRLGKALNKSIKFFESLEEYEKCAFLAKIEKFLKENLDS